MYAVVVRLMDDAGLMGEAGFLFFWMRVIFPLIKIHLLSLDRCLLSRLNVKLDR